MNRATRKHEESEAIMADQKPIPMLIKMWNGPVDIKPMANLIRSAGYENIIEGTEHIYFTAWATPNQDLFSIYWALREGGLPCQFDDFTWKEKRS